MGPAHPRPRIFLIGPSGAGKSSIGERLAERLGQPFLDVDQEIEKQAKRSIREIFRTQGEGEFRDLERNTIARLVHREGVVLATGGGAVLDAGTRLLLNLHGRSVYLHADVATLLQRTMGDTNRPLLAGAMRRARMSTMLHERDPFYRELAECSVDTSSCKPMEVVERIVTWLEGLGEMRPC